MKDLEVTTKYKLLLITKEFKTSRFVEVVAGICSNLPEDDPVGLLWLLTGVLMSRWRRNTSVTACGTACAALHTLSAPGLIFVVWMLLLVDQSQSLCLFYKWLLLRFS